ncbi:AAA_23 domain-containing protein, partial [Haematococcus lacustris]
TGKTSKLTLQLGGEDLTRIKIPDTQALISDLFSTDLLRHAVFYGQNDITLLLEAGDRQLKELLQRVCDMQLWEDARLYSIAPQRKSVKDEVQQVSGQHQLLQRLLGEAADQLSTVRQQEAQWQQQRQEAQVGLEQQLRQCQANTQQAVAPLLGWGGLLPPALQQVEALEGAVMQQLASLSAAPEPAGPSNTLTTRGASSASEMEGATINGKPTITSTFSASAGASVGNTENNTESSEAEQYALSLSLSVSKYMSDAEAAAQAEMLGELRTQRDVANTAWRTAELAVVRLRRESELGMEKQRAWVEGLVAPTAKPAAVNGGGPMNGNGVPAPPPILSIKSAVTPVHAAARMSTETLSTRSSPLSASGPELLDWLVAKVSAGDLQPQCDKCEQDVEVAHFMRRVRELKAELSRCEQELREAEQLEAYQREGYQKAAGALALKEQAVQRERAERERLVRDELSAQASRAREQQAAEAR